MTFNREAALQMAELAGLSVDGTDEVRIQGFFCRAVVQTRPELKVTWSFSDASSRLVIALMALTQLMGLGLCLSNAFLIGLNELPNATSIVLGATLGPTLLVSIVVAIAHVERARISTLIFLCRGDASTHAR